MNVSEAKRLLDDLKFELENADLKTVRLSKIFIAAKSIFGQPVLIKRRSLRGRLTLFFSLNKSEKLEELRIREYVATAFKSVVSSESPKTLSDLRWWTKLNLEFNQGSAAKESYQLPLNEELDLFEQFHSAFTAEKIDQRLNQIRRLSLLNSSKMSFHPIRDLESFIRMTQFYEEMSIEALQAYQEYLKRNNPNHPLFSSRLALVEKAKEQNAALNTEIGECENLEERRKHLRMKATDFEKNVQGLKIGQSCFFQGSFGRKKIDLQQVLLLINKLPDNIKEGLRDVAPYLFGISELPTPETFIHENLQIVLKGIEKNVEDGQLDFLKTFLPEEKKSKSLPNLLQNHLPENMKALLEKGLNTTLLDILGFLSQKIPPKEMTDFFEMISQLGDLTDHPTKLGIILQIIRVVPPESAVNVLRVISENLLLLPTPLGRKELFDKIDAMIKKHPFLNNGSMKGVVETKLMDLVKGGRSNIPSEVMQLVDPEGFFSYSDFWIEFKREDDKSFTLLIYPSKALLNKHPVNDQKVQWPLKLSPISSQKLNRELFHKLLFEMIEPLYNPEYHVRVEDVYQGILGYFDHKVALEDGFWSDKTDDLHTEMGITKLLITPSNISSQITTIQAHFELIISLCSSYKNKDGLLLITSKEVCEALENSLSPLMSLVEKSKEQLTSDLYQRFKATEEEILHAIHVYKLTITPQVDVDIVPNEFHISETFFKYVQTIFHGAGVDDAMIISHKQTLCWAFGDEIEDFIEALAAFVGPSPKENVQPVDVKQDLGEKGWLKNFVSSVFFHLAFTALRTVLSAVQIYQKGMSAIGGLYLTQTVASYFLPHAAKQWLHQVWGQLLRHCVQMSAYLFLRVLLNPEQIEQMQVYALTWKQNLHRLANQALGKEMLSFELTPLRKNEEEIEELIPKTEVALPLEHQAHFPTHENLLAHLREWESNLKKNQRINRPDLLDLLPVPYHGNDLFWDCVSNLNQCRHILENATKNIQVYVLDPVYKLVFYAIINKLSKKSVYDKNILYTEVEKISQFQYQLSNSKDYVRLYHAFNYLSGLPKGKPFKSKSLIVISQDRCFSISTSKCNFKTRLSNPFINSNPFEQVPGELTLFHGRPDPQDLSLVLGALKLRMGNIEKDPFFSLMFKRFINSLPTPKRENDSFWDSVSNPDDCLKMLGALAINVLNMETNLSREMQGSKMIMAYGIFAMLDKLRKAIPDLYLDGYELDYYDLLIELQDRGTLITNPSDLKRLEEVLNYYGYSFDRLPDLKEVQKRKNRALFSGSNGGFIDFFCPVEAKYLEKRLQEPQIQEKFSERIFSIESFKKLKDGPPPMIEIFMDFFFFDLFNSHTKKLNGLEQYQRVLKAIEEPNWQEKYPDVFDVFERIIIPEEIPISKKVELLTLDTFSSVKWEENSDLILPGSYTVLKTFVFQCKSLSRWIFNREEEKHLSNQYFPFGVKKQWLSQKKPHINGLGSDFAGMVNATPGLIDNAAEYVFFKSQKPLFILEHLKESEVIDYRNKKDLDYSYELHLARSERSETVFHMIAYFHEKPERLAKEGSFLYKAIFESVCLPHLLSKQPHLVNNIQTFFSDTFEYFYQSNYGRALWILHVWRKTILMMQTQIQEDFFSPFELMLKKLEKASSLSIETKSAYHELNTLFLLDHGKMNEQLVASFFYSDFFPGYYQKVFESQSDLSSHFEMLNLDRFSSYWENLPKVKEYLKDPENLQKSMKAIISHLEIDLPELNSDSKWTAISGRDFIFASGPYEVSLWNGSIELSETGEDLTHKFVTKSIPPVSSKAEVEKKASSKKSLKRVAKEHLGYSMSALSRFCPIEQIEVFTLKGTSQIENLVFTPFKLFFSMKHSPEGVRAYSKDFAGFYIAPKQFTPVLNRFGSYLLLQNEAGGRRVILPQHQWLSGLAMRYLKHMGPWATMAISLLNQARKDAETFSVFELTSDNQLKSENPEDLVFLITLYYLQDNKEGVKETSKLFEKACKLKNVNKLTYERLFPLFILPLGFQDISHTRQHLLSVIEEAENISVKERIKLDASHHIAIAAMILMDLSQQKSPNLTEFQEWFLFRAYFYHAKAALQDQEEATSGIFWILNATLQRTLESLVLPRHLVDRLEFLEKKFGIETSKGSKVLRFASKVANTTVKLPAFIDALKPAPSSFSYKELGISLVRTGIINPFSVESLKLESLVHELGVHEKEICFLPSFLTAKQFKESWLAYFEIATTRGGKRHPQYTQLSQMLSLLNGWDKQTRLLIDYLRAAMQFPAIFSAQTLNDLVKSYLNPDPILGDRKVCQEKTLKMLEDFFSALNIKSMGLALGKSVIGWGKSKIIDRSNFPGMGSNLSLAPLSYGLTSSTRWALSLGQAALNQWNAIPIQTERRSIVSDVSYYSYLNEEDQFFNCELKEIYDLAFVSFIENLPEEAIFKQLTIQGAEHVNDSITDYYNLNKNPEKIWLKNESALWSAYYLLSRKLSHYQAQLDREKQKFATLFANQINNSEELFQQLQACFLQGDFTPLMKNTTFEPEVLQSLELAVCRYFVRLTRIQQMQRAACCMEEMALLEMTPNLQAEKVQRFAEILSNERGYQFHDKGLRLLRRLLVFEVSTGQLLWKKQSDVVEKICTEKNATYELLCALGKNWAIQPLLDAFLANGEQAVVNIFPAPVFDPCYRNLAIQGQIFQQEANLWRFNRSSKLTVENLEALLTVLTRAIKQYETINMTKEDIQSLELNFVIRMDRYIRNKRNDSNEEKILLKLAQLLETFQKKCVFVGDEAHELFNHRQELNYPIGSSTVLTADDYFMIEGCMDAAAEILQEIKTRNQKFSETEYTAHVAIPVAKLMVKHPSFRGLSESQYVDLERYFISRENGAASWIEKHELFRQFSMVRGAITELLFLTMNVILNVDYGTSLHNKGEYARPYAGNTSPLENFTISDPHEAMVKTFSQFLQTGLNDTQLYRIIQHLFAQIYDEAESRQLLPTKTKRYKDVLDVFGNLYDPLEILTITDAQMDVMRHHPKMILLYVRHFVRSQVRYWKESACSNVQDFGLMSKSGFYGTATPGNFGTYPPQLKMLWDPGTLGEAIHVIKQKYRGCHTFAASSPEGVLEESLQTHFSQSNDFTVLADCGPSPLLKGLKNAEVAQLMITFIKKHRPDILGVVFFDSNDRVVYLAKDATEPVPLENAQVLPEQRLTYIDDHHGFSANIFQKPNAAAFVLTGERSTLTRLVQLCFRLRRLKNDFKLESSVFKIDTSTVQTVHFGVLKEFKDKFSPEKDLTISEFVNIGTQNEFQTATEENYASYPSKLTAVDRRASLNKIYASRKSFKEMSRLFTELRSLLVRKIEVDPRIKYAPIKMKEKSAHVCAKIRESSFKSIENNPNFTKDEKETLRTIRDTIPLQAMPEYVNAYFSQNEFKYGLMQNMNQMMQIENDNNDENDMNRDVNAQRQINYQISQDSANLFHDWSWKENFDPHTCDWCAFSPALNTDSWMKKLSKMFSSKENPPLFAVTDLLEHSQRKEFSSIKDCFDSRLWFSNNYLPTYVSFLTETQAMLGTSEQRVTWNVLVQVDETDSETHIISMGCISIGDTASLSKQLDKYPAKTSRKTFIYDVREETFKAGTVNLDLLKKNPDFIACLTQLKFLGGVQFYNTGEMTYLEKWIRQNGRNDLQHAFDAIQKNSKKSMSKGSDISLLFNSKLTPFQKL